MPDIAIADVQQVALGLALLVPGALIIFVRSRFFTGRRKAHSEEFLSYAIVTLLYLAIFLPVFEAVYKSGSTPRQIWALWVVLILIGPLTIGTFLGLAYQHGWTAWVLRSLGLEIVHPIPTAWDWKFGQRKAEWVIVKLKDGTYFRGWYGAESFASSEPGDRDIYIQQIFVEREDGDKLWDETNRSAYIAGSEISTIEFIDPSEARHGN
ncbi:DUF6338 family protein [Mesorhizobium sp. 2RAF45]|uniref:DUF6338 family protein n=1 Tax=Mesorhizobium sp. 2RAF45 TaxID=3233001 RepID=UPI003F9D86FA